MKARLETLVDLLKDTYKINEDMANEKSVFEGDYDRGTKAGMRIANKMYERRIKRLEQIVSQMDSFMEEDVQLDGSDFTEKEVV